MLPELAESRLNPPDVTDMRQDMAAFDRLFRLPAARMRVLTTLAGARSPWLALGEEVLDVAGAWISETAWGLPYGDPGSAFQARRGAGPGRPRAAGRWRH